MRFSVLTVLFLLSSPFLSAQPFDTQKAFDYLKLGKLSELETYLVSYQKKEKKNPDVHYYLGRLYMKLKNYDEAVDAFEEAIDLNNKKADYYFWLGNCYVQMAMNANMIKHGWYAGKIKNNFEKAIELDPKNIDARFGLINFYVMAPGVMGGSDEKAKDQVKKIAEINAYSGYIASGQYFRMNKKLDEAIGEFKKAIQSDPTKTKAYYDLGNMYLNQQKYKEAIDLFEQGLKNIPEESLFNYQLARAATIGKIEVEKAVKSLEKCLKELNGDLQTTYRPYIYYQLGLAAELSGNKVEARKQFELALKEKPDLKEAKEALEKL